MGGNVGSRSCGSAYAPMNTTRTCSMTNVTTAETNVQRLAASCVVASLGVLPIFEKPAVIRAEAEKMRPSGARGPDAVVCLCPSSDLLCSVVVLLCCIIEYCNVLGRRKKFANRSVRIAFRPPVSELSSQRHIRELTLSIRAHHAKYARCTQTLQRTVSSHKPLRRCRAWLPYSKSARAPRRRT